MDVRYHGRRMARDVLQPRVTPRSLSPLAGRAVHPRGLCMSGTVLAPVQATFRAVADTVVPEAASLEPGEMAGSRSPCGRNCARSALRGACSRQLVIFLRLIEYLPLLQATCAASRGCRSPARTALLARLGVRPRDSSLLPARLLGAAHLGPARLLHPRRRAGGARATAPHAEGWNARRTTAEMRAAAAEPFGEEDQGA
jgi:hypothetical protein